LQIENLQIKDLVSDPNNVRVHSEQNLDAIKQSLKRFEQQKPIVIDSNNVVVAGNGTLQAALSLGWKEIKAVRLPASFTEAEKKAFAIADNRTAELAQWNTADLDNQLLELNELGFDPKVMGFTSRDMENILRISEAKTTGVTDVFKEWAGMPEFVQSDKRSEFRTVIHFPTEKDADEFFALIDRPKKNAMWWPETDGHIGSAIGEAYIATPTKTQVGETKKNQLVDFYHLQLANRNNLPLPAYPIYIPTKGRADIATTPKILAESGVPFILAVEKEDVANYRSKFPTAEILELPESNQGIVYSRNFCKADAKKKGVAYHWQIDDDIRKIAFSVNAKETNMPFAQGLAIAEAFTKHYDNIGAMCLRHLAFSRTEKHDVGFNKIIYGIQLLSSEPNIWFRNNTIEDIDNTMQLLTAGYCTLVLNRLVFSTPSTGVEKGGNTENSHQLEAREARARNTQNNWPNAFKLRKTNVGIRIAPSRIWSTFPQTPVEKNVSA
jgi:hypothetical protein